MATLYLENKRQVALFITELTGQFSDGAWENSGPEGHWRPWFDCEVKVAPEGQEPGRDFWVRKDGYALHSLIDYVGDRMIFIGNLAEQIDEIPECGVPDSQWDWEHTQKMAVNPDYPGDYYIEKWVQMDDAGITDEVVARAASGSYDEKALRRDLSAIRKAMKNRLLVDLA